MHADLFAQHRHRQGGDDQWRAGGDGDHLGQLQVTESDDEDPDFDHQQHRSADLQPRATAHRGAPHPALRVARQGQRQGQKNGPADQQDLRRIEQSGEDFGDRVHARQNHRGAAHQQDAETAIGGGDVGRRGHRRLYS